MQQALTSDYIRYGLAVAGRKPGIVLLIWAIQLFVAIIVAIPLAGAMSILAETGFSADMARDMDVELFADMMRELGPAWRLVLLNLLWTLPLLAVVRAVTSVGIINAVRDEGLRSFWAGVGTYGLRSIGISAIYFLLTALLQAGVFLVAVSVASAMGEMGTVLLFTVALPVGVFVVGCLSDCMRDYSQIALVTRDAGVSKAFGDGVKWPMANRRALALYGFWIVPAFVTTLLPLLFENLLVAATMTGILTLGVLQQFALVLRAAVTVGWYGSETRYYDEVAEQALPLIADIMDPDPLDPGTASLSEPQTPPQGGRA